jgi:endonuclease III
MVRDDDVDTGLWKSIDKAKLIVPVDVHISRLCKMLGLYERKTVCLSAATEITQSFAEIEPADPVKYDFALSRVGIVENCEGSFRLECADCELVELCRPRVYDKRDSRKASRVYA